MGEGGQSDEVAALRREYADEPLAKSAVDPDPIVQFRHWFRQAQAANLDEHNAMTLATATADGRPSARMVLLKGVDDSGFTFFTNYEGRKAAELAANPWAALVFWWAPLARQVRVEGKVARLPEAESEAYFAGRPWGSQIGAWASPQSRVIADRALLDGRWAEVSARFAVGPVPRPPHWGGYRVAPVALELWQGRPNRLHDRLRYERLASGAWRLERLAP